MSDDSDLFGRAAERLRSQGRSQEAALVESAVRRGQPHRVHGLVRELDMSSAVRGVAAMQQQPVNGRPAPAAGAPRGSDPAAQALQREEPDPAV